MCGPCVWGVGTLSFFQKIPYRGVGPCVWGVGTLIFFENKSLYMGVWALCVGCGPCVWDVSALWVGVGTLNLYEKQNHIGVCGVGGTLSVSEKIPMGYCEIPYGRPYGCGLIASRIAVKINVVL